MPSGTSTTPDVPRMPSVAVGVVIFMSPVLATSAATKATVPLATSNTAELLAAVLIDQVVDRDVRVGGELEGGASLKVTPRAEFAEVCSTSLR